MGICAWFPQTRVPTLVYAVLLVMPVQSTRAKPGYIRAIYKPGVSAISEVNLKPGYIRNLLYPSLMIMAPQKSRG